MYGIDVLLFFFLILRTMFSRDGYGGKATEGGREPSIEGFFSRRTTTLQLILAFLNVHVCTKDDGGWDFLIFFLFLVLVGSGVPIFIPEDRDQRVTST